MVAKQNEKRERETGHDVGGGGGGWLWWRRSRNQPRVVGGQLCLPLRKPLFALLPPQCIPEKNTAKGAETGPLDLNAQRMLPSGGPFVLLDTFFLDHSLDPRLAKPR